MNFEYLKLNTCNYEILRSHDFKFYSCRKFGQTWPEITDFKKIIYNRTEFRNWQNFAIET